MTERCFACGKPISGKPRVVITEDGAQLPWVGPDCYKRVKASGAAGWQPMGKRGKSGPRLFMPPTSAGSGIQCDATTAALLGLS